MNESSASKQLKKTAMLTLIWVIIAMLAAGGATYAWFTFSASSRVIDGAGTVGTTTDLLISNSPDGPFDVNCELKPYGAELSELLPITTKDLRIFYAPETIEKDGTPITYSDITKDIADYAMCGELYLLAQSKGCRVSLYGPRVSFGGDEAFLSAGRLGLVVKCRQGTYTYIFELNKMDDYLAGGTEDDPTEPAKALCTIEADEIAEIDYYLYLEGSDSDCVNSVMNKDFALSICFAGF